MKKIDIENTIFEFIETPNRTSIKFKFQCKTTTANIIRIYLKNTLSLLEI